MIKNNNKKGTYWKLTPKRRKIEAKRWFRTYFELGGEKEAKLKDIAPSCVMCNKTPVRWGIKVNDFKSDIFPDVDLRYIYCCSEICTAKACALINLGGVKFKERK